MPRPASISIELLETFVLLIRNEGDTLRTAAELGINQPSISKRLQFLQHAGRPLSRPWLERRGRRWVLTEEGQSVFAAVEDLIQRYHRLVGFAAQTAPPALRFACGQQSVVGFVEAASIEFRKLYPEVRLRISTMRGRARIESVAAGLLDLATVTHDDADIREIARQPLFIEPISTTTLVAVGTSTAVWSDRFGSLSKKTVTAADLVKFPLIMPEPDSGVRQSMERHLRDEKRWNELDVVLEIGGTNAMLSYVRAGHGIGLLSRSAVADETGLIVKQVSSQDFPAITTRLICRLEAGTDNTPDLSPEAQSFRSLLIAATKS